MRSPASCPFSRREARRLYEEYGSIAVIARRTGFTMGQVHYWMVAFGIPRWPGGLRKRPRPISYQNEPRAVRLVQLQRSAPQEFERLAAAILNREIILIGLPMPRISYLLEALEAHARELALIAVELGPGNGAACIRDAVEDLQKAASERRTARRWTEGMTGSVAKSHPGGADQTWSGTVVDGQLVDPISQSFRSCLVWSNQAAMAT